jgi:hypothetical protein
MIVNLSAPDEALKNHSEVVMVGSARARPFAASSRVGAALGLSARRVSNN